MRDEAFYGEDELSDGPGGKKFAPSGAEAEWVEEPSYFFRLSDWQDWLVDFYEANPDAVAPRTRRNEVMSFVRGGLQDLSISRTSFNWGVPVPDDPDHIMYVWLDALTNYVTAVGYPDTESDTFTKYWPADLHMVGKDILRFHSVYWPAFLEAAGVAPPKRVFAHGWWTNEGEKISKSLGNIIDPYDIVARYGLDQVRYFLMREVPFGNDGDFSHQSVVRRINSDLANDLGNLVQRVLSMVSRNCDGKAPKCEMDLGLDGFAVYSALVLGRDLINEVREEMDRQAFNQALDAIWSVVREANRCIDADAPWAIRKTDPDRMAAVLYLLMETIRHIAIVLQPFMPDSCGRILDQLAVSEDARTFEHLGDGHALTPGTKLPKPEPVFPRFVEDEATAEA